MTKGDYDTVTIKLVIPAGLRVAASAKAGGSRNPGFSGLRFSAFAEPALACAVLDTGCLIRGTASGFRFAPE
jgi:hypothetical protein